MFCKLAIYNVIKIQLEEHSLDGFLFLFKKNQIKYYKCTPDNRMNKNKYIQYMKYARFTYLK